ncbi:MAG: LysR family transcriptional regulator, partial [Rudaea sp.]|nr:LysR family transcriptional regulator [Rudaea sp.]
MKDTLNVLLSRLRMKQLQLLIALDDHTSLHKAAGAMSMTQSAASKALQELESMLDERHDSEPQWSLSYHLYAALGEAQQP